MVQRIKAFEATCRTARLLLLHYQPTCLPGCDGPSVPFHHSAIPTIEVTNLNFIYISLSLGEGCKTMTVVRAHICGRKDNEIRTNTKTLANVCRFGGLMPLAGDVPIPMASIHHFDFPPTARESSVLLTNYYNTNTNKKQQKRKHFCSIMLRWKESHYSVGFDRVSCRNSSGTPRCGVANPKTRT